MATEPVGARHSFMAHGPQTAFYFSDGAKFRPAILCLCGWETERSCDSWSEAGEQFDEHLAEVSA